MRSLPRERSESVLLGVHHVRDDLGGPMSWDSGFLAFGALLVVGMVVAAHR
jgi:uncharacterized membrane protein